MENSSHINLGTFAVGTIISLILLIRGDMNDSYAAILVFLIALFQLFEYGLWQNLECNPGSANDKASRGSYILFWLIPALLCLSGAFLANNIIAAPASKILLLGAGFILLALAAGLAPIALTDKATWCTQMGYIWQPQWWWLKSPESPMKPNFVWLLGILIPTILVDPFLLGTGTIGILTAGYFVGKDADTRMEGEWLSVTAYMANLIGFWALIVPGLRWVITPRLPF
jgi:hypothetical protein